MATEVDMSTLNRKRIGRNFRFIGVIVVLLAGCGGTDGSLETTEATTTQTADATTAGPDTTTETPETTPSGVTETTVNHSELESTNLRLATSPPSFDTITDAYWLQLLEEAGIEVETFEFETSPDTVRAVAAGEGDLVNTSPLAIMQYIEASDGGLQVIAVELLKTDYYLMSTPEVGSLEDLEGQIVGISEPGDLSDSLTRVVLEEAGIDVSSIEFAQIGGTSARVAALADGQIQAGAAHAADGLAAAEEFGLQPLARYVDYVPDYAQRFLAATPEWLEEHPALAQFLVDTLIEAQRWAQEDKDAYIALSEEVVEGLPAEISSDVYDLFADEGFFAVNGGMNMIDPTAQLEQRQGNLSDDLPDRSTWVDPTYVEDYLGRVGEY
ncbi:MAG: PhnD/SsuA/transferrin family substrate-binding protein [Acidimicrobiia bacterium]|nr:PhnD/SsuA/transferrin family substrate-binding protein [Acidimicrobiia bacterium]